MGKVSRLYSDGDRDASQKRSTPDKHKNTAKSGDRSNRKKIHDKSATPEIEDMAVSMRETDESLSQIAADLRTDSMGNSELAPLVHSLQSKVSDFQEKISALRGFLKEQEQLPSVAGDDIVDYLATKQQMLLAYCANLLFYLGLRVSGISVKDHPVLEQLLRLRFALEKMRAIDGKIQHQIERLVQLEQAGQGGLQAAVGGAAFEGEDKQPILATSNSSLRPNPLALLGGGSGSDSGGAAGEESDEEEESNEDDEMDQRSKRNKSKKAGITHTRDGDEYGSSAGKGLYRPPRMEAVPFLDAEGKAEKEAERLKRKRQKLRSTEIFETLREEFSTAPEQSASGGISGLSQEGKKLQAEADERQNFEEDRFVRLTMSRKDKKDINRRTKDMSDLTKLGDFGGIEDFDEIINMFGADGPAGTGGGAGAGGGSSSKRASRRDDSSRESLGDSKQMRKLGSAVNSSAAIERAAMTFGKFEGTDTGEMRVRGGSAKKAKARRK